MHLFALILGIWLLPKGDTLKCFECISWNCTETQRECLLQSHQCGVFRAIYYEGGSKFLDQEFKTCFLPEQCGETSVNYGFSRLWAKTECCNSNLCNTQAVPEPSKATPNGRQCFTCDGSTCDKTLDCEGTEDHCVTTTVDVGGNTTTVKGCISKLICYLSNGFPSLFPGEKISCCKGNLCNSADTVSAGLQLVVVTLVSLTLFT